MDKTVFICLILMGSITGIFFAILLIDHILVKMGKGSFLLHGKDVRYRVYRVDYVCQKTVKILVARDLTRKEARWLRESIDEYTIVEREV